jgi:hypothetical protein
VQLVATESTFRSSISAQSSGLKSKSRRKTAQRKHQGVIWLSTDTVWRVGDESNKTEFLSGVEDRSYVGLCYDQLVQPLITTTNKSITTITNITYLQRQPRSIVVELYLNYPIRLYGTVLNSLSTRTTLSLPLLPILQQELLLPRSHANYDAMLSQFHSAPMFYPQPICPRFWFR